MAFAMLVAQGDYRSVAIVSTIAVLASAVLAWVLSLSMGAFGIALGLSISNSISCGVLVVIALRSFRLR